MNKCCAALIVFFVGLLQAQADVPTKFSLETADALLPDGGEGLRQSATAQTFGAVTIQEIALARRIAAKDSKIASVQQHASVFDFFLVPVSFGVLGFDGQSCQSLQFGATLRSPGAGPTEIFILDVFPRSSLAPGSIAAGAKLAITGDLKIAAPTVGPVAGSVGVDGKANVDWEWKPLFQKTGAIFDQTRVFWSFDKVGAEFPVGQAEVQLIIAVTKKYTKKPAQVIGLEVELRAQFASGWFERGVARQNATILVKLP